MKNIFPAFSEEKWEQVRTHPYYASAVKKITETSEKMLTEEPKRILFSQIHLFAETGDRKIFERVYNDYMMRMHNYFFMYCLRGEEKYLKALADILWNICDFESWSIPAHVQEALTPQLRRENLDLCSCRVGWYMSLILHYLGDKLPDLVVRRAKYELRFRIIESYKKNTYHWMTVTNNWSAVCIAGVLGTYLYEAAEEEIEEQLPRMLETMNCYLRGFDDEGCCLEGYGYWVYGYSHFCFFADMLRNYTDGRINLFEDPKVRAIAHFQENITINETQCINFSDCSQHFYPCEWLTHFLKSVYPDLTLAFSPECPEYEGVVYEILWSNPALADSHLAPKSFMFKNNQWYIYRSAAYNMACKAGHNSEPHNHNDVGSFIISKNGKVTYGDPGGGEYTRQYFSGERYTILEPSSRAHSVPIIGGEYQVTGKKKSTVYCAEEGHYAYSMENAYSIPSLTSLKREFVCEADRIILTDTYDFTEAPASVVERFVSNTMPEITSEGVRCGDTLLVFDPADADVQIGSECRIRGGKEAAPLYFTDLTVKNPQEKMEIRVEFR